MRVSGSTRLYCLIGDPVRRSLSPWIMNRAFEQLGFDAVYTALRVPAAQLPEALAGLRALGVRGANVTYPHKEAVLPFIDRPSERTEILRAANTLRFARGEVTGYNTDAAGTAIALERFAGLSLNGKRVLIFGSGGAGRAAAFGVLEAGAASVAFCVRNAPKAEAALSPLRRVFADSSISVVPLEEQKASDRRRAAVVESDVLINATPVGMAGAYGSAEARGPAGARGSADADGSAEAQGGSVVPPAVAARVSSPAGTAAASPLIEDPEWIRPGHCCFDFVYAPRETAFLGIARARGALRLGGLSLLLAQALEAFRCWTGLAFDLEEMGTALESHAGQSIFALKE